MTSLYAAARKRTPVNGTFKGHTNGHVNGHANGHSKAAVESNFISFDDFVDTTDAFTGDFGLGPCVAGSASRSRHRTPSPVGAAELRGLLRDLRLQGGGGGCAMAAEGAALAARVAAQYRQGGPYARQLAEPTPKGVMPIAAREPPEEPAPESSTENVEEEPQQPRTQFISKEEIQRMRAEMRQQCAQRQMDRQRQQASQAAEDTPLLLSMRMRRVLEFGLRHRHAAGVAQDPGNAMHTLMLQDGEAQVAAALIFYHRFPPAIVKRFLANASLEKDGVAGLYTRLLDTMRCELRNDQLSGADWATPIDGRPPATLPVGLGATASTLCGPIGAVTSSMPAARKDDGPGGPLRGWFGPEEDRDSDSFRSQSRINTTDLPIHARKEQIMDTVRQNKITLLQGETGSGKTTQVPKYILEMLENDRRVNGLGQVHRIVCTQPRRIAAVTVAKRVAQELGETVGEGVVGYKIRGQSVAGPNCKVLFCTTGVLLRRLAREGQDTMFSPKTVTHLLVDEVHERSCETDFMLTFLRQVLHARPHLRVVLMSATMDAECFLHYFTLPGIGTPPMVKVSGRCYDTLEVCLDEINAKLGRDVMSPGMSYDQIRREGGAPQQTSDSDGIDYDLVVDILQEIDASENGAWCFGEDGENIEAPANCKDGAVLIFLPGVGEISEMLSKIEEAGVPSHWWVLQLHGSLSAEEQQDAFQTNFPEGKTWKIIVCTNVAETSVTVPDVTVVIDSCRERRTGIDKFSNTPQLKEQYCALDSLRQRRGRAGRVRPGVCLRLISTRKMEGLDTKTPPEMQRVPLENVYLQLCACGIRDRNGFLASTPDPPEESSVTFARTGLQDIGALDDSAADGMTALGRHLANLPCHPRLGKILVLGCLLGVPGPALSICGAMSGRSPLKTTQDAAKRAGWQAERSKLLKELGHRSDHCVWAVLMQLWVSEGVVRRDLCIRYGLAYERMAAAFFERKHFCEALQQAGLLPSNFLQEERENPPEPPDWTIVRAVIAGGLFPNVAHVEKVVQPRMQQIQASGPGERNKRLRYSILQRHISENDSLAYPKVCNMHPNSMCFGEDGFGCPWLVFNTIQQTTKLYVYDASEASPWALLLFGSQPVWSEHKQVLEVGGWARFSCSAVDQVLPLINEARAALQAILARKVQDTGYNVAKAPELMACAELLRTEGLGFEVLPGGEPGGGPREWPALEELRAEAAARGEHPDHHEDGV